MSEREHLSAEVEKGERLEKSDFRIGLISDTQNLDQPETVVDKLQGERLDMVFHTGDIAVGSRMDEVVGRAKRIFNIKRGLVQGHLSTEDEKEYGKITAMSEFEQFVKSGDPDFRAYRRCVMLRDPSIAEEDQKTERDRIQKIVSALAQLGVPASHLMGNVDIADKPREGTIDETETKAGVQTLKEPSFIDLGEEAGIIVWPYQNINPQDRDADQILRNKAQELAEKAKGKKQILIIGHEHILKGSKDYAQNSQSTFDRDVRIPRSQPASSRRYLQYLFEHLPADAKIAYTFGHLHDPREVMLAGMPYLREEGGKIHFKVGMPGTENERDIEFIYLPQGKAGIVEISKEGFEFTEK